MRYPLQKQAIDLGLRQLVADIGSVRSVQKLHYIFLKFKGIINYMEKRFKEDEEAQEPP